MTAGVAAATQLNLRFVKEVFSGEKSPQLATLEEIIDGFSLNGRAILREELRALEIIAIAQWRAQQAARRVE